MKYVPFYSSLVIIDAVNMDMCTLAFNYLSTNISISHSVKLTALSLVFFRDLFDFLLMSHSQQLEYGLITPAELKSSCLLSSLK
jgi:hypothetical protein